MSASEIPSLDNDIEFSEELSKFKMYCQVLGYMSKIQVYDNDFNILLDELKLFQQKLISKYNSSISHNLLKKIVVPINNNRWFKKGKMNFDCIKNYSIYYYRKQLLDCSDNNDYDKSKLESIILNIISIDTFYNIYDDTIEYVCNINDKFKNIMHKDFGEHVFI
jgi:hypothetical protein